VVASHGRGLIVDRNELLRRYFQSMLENLRFDALIAGIRKMPRRPYRGMGFVIGRREALERSGGNSSSLALDLLDQWQYMRKTGQWRFTPPTHVVAALRAAIDQYQAQGRPGRSIGSLQ